MQLLFPGYYVCYYVGYYIGYYVGYYIGYYVMLLFIPVKTGGPYPRLRDFFLYFKPTKSNKNTQQTKQLSPPQNASS